MSKTLLPTNVDDLYPDDPADPSRKVHQDHHDVIHERLNSQPIVTSSDTPPVGPDVGDLWFDGLGVPAAAVWSSFTPTIVGTGWALGNGTLTAAYARLEKSKTVVFRIQLLFGSTTTAGSVAPTFTLPVNRVGSHPVTFPAHAFDLSASAFYPCLAVSNLTTLLTALGPGSPAAALTSSAPFTWATGDWLNIVGTYEGV